MSRDDENARRMEVSQELGRELADYFAFIEDTVGSLITPDEINFRLRGLKAGVQNEPHILDLGETIAPADRAIDLAGWEDSRSVEHELVEGPELALVLAAIPSRWISAGEDPTANGVSHVSLPIGVGRKSALGRYRFDERLDKGPSTRRYWALVAVLVLLLLMSPAVTVLIYRHILDRNSATYSIGSASPVPTAALGPQACIPRANERLVPSSVPTSPGLIPLAGRVFYHDVTGFRIGVISDWVTSRIGTLVCFREPRGVRVLAVDQEDLPAADPLEEALRREPMWVGAAGLPAYQRIDLRRKQFFGGQAAELEYTYVDVSGDPMHGMILYVATPRRLYTIYWQVRHADWPAQFDNYLNSTMAFMPAE